MSLHKVFFTGYAGHRRPHPGEGIKDLEGIFKYSFDFKKLKKSSGLTNVNEYQAQKYLIKKLEEAESKKGFFDERDFELAMRSLVKQGILTAEQSDGIFTLARGNKLAYKEELEEEKEKTKESKETEELETRDDLFSSRSSDEKDYERGLLNEAQDEADAKENAERVAASIRARAAAIKAAREQEIRDMGEDI